MTRIIARAALMAVLGFASLSLRTWAADAPGDRIPIAPRSFENWVPSCLPKEDYRVGPGDVLSIVVRCRSGLGISSADGESGGEKPEPITVSPTGDICLPLVGKLEVTGKTATEIEDLVRAGLAKYVKNFTVTIAVVRLRTINIFVSGEAANPGAQIIPSVCTASIAALQAGIKPTGSTRRIALSSGDTRRTLDVYRMTMTGDLSADARLEPGDSIYIPPVTRFAEVTGEVTRPGRYEMFRLSGEEGEFRARDLLDLALGTLPSAALDKAFIERIGDDGRKTAIPIDLRGGAKSSALDTSLQPGDVLVIPSISAFQPIVRLVGEFKGDGVYQRAPGSTAEDGRNKGGIYFLKQGQTVLDVIAATGGVTPQADLKRARIEREENGAVRTIPLDLDRLLVRGDESADAPLRNGDSIILPAIADRIHVLGEIRAPGSYAYSPNRRLIDYLGDAGGPTSSAKMTHITIVRGGAENPKPFRVDAYRAIRRGAEDGNPILQPGDIVYVPRKFINDWRDAVQLIFTSLSLSSLLRQL